MDNNISELKAQRAIYAARMYHTKGRYAAMAYARKHGVLGLMRLARQLEAAANI